MNAVYNCDIKLYFSWAEGLSTWGGGGGAGASMEQQHSERPVVVNYFMSVS